jgi:hypothetical protein
MKKTLMTLLALLLSSYIPSVVQASWDPRTYKDFDVKVEYRDFSDQDAVGDPIYQRGERVWYRVIIRNNGNRPFKNLPVTATLVWDRDMTCIRPDGSSESEHALDPLPGDSVSGPHLLALGKDSYTFFDGFYVVPNAVCSNSGIVKLDAGRETKDPSRILGYRFSIR